MIRLQIDDRPVPAVGLELPLGEALALELARRGPEVETRIFLRHDAILYPRPLRDWSPEESFSFLPEAPGSYRLLVDWREHDRARGRMELEFEVGERRAGDAVPTLEALPGGARLWAPSAWEGAVAMASERAMLEQVRRLLAERVGDGADEARAFYDVGASFGRYAIELAQLLPKCDVICFEANPVCVHYLRANVAENRLRNVEIVPAALLDREGSIELCVHYANSNLGATRDSRVFAQKVGHEIEVPCYRLDDLVDRFALPPPRLLKLDVEGAEASSLRGMAGTLERHRPFLALELHGAEAAAEALALLDGFGYRYRHPESGRELGSAAEVAGAELGVVFQLIARCDVGRLAGESDRCHG
jgi:FkbM family methyltransferase